MIIEQNLKDIEDCKNEYTIIKSHISETEKINWFNVSKGEDWNIDHWHMVFLDENEYIIWPLLKHNIK